MSIYGAKLVTVLHYNLKAKITDSPKGENQRPLPEKILYFVTTAQLSTAIKACISHKASKPTREKKMKLGLLLSCLVVVLVVFEEIKIDKEKGADQRGLCLRVHVSGE